VRPLLAILPVLILAGCAGSHQTVTPRPKTRLSVQVNGGHGITRYSLSCRPAGGSAPHPATACRALEDFLPRREASHSACMCALYVKSIVVRGVLDGRRLARPLEVSGCSACGLGAGARSDVEHAFAAFHLTPV
jgi:hypothetical protein